MNKNIKTTSDIFIESLSAQELKKFKNEYKTFALSELIFALMEHDEVSVRALAKIAGISPTVVQAMRSGTKSDFTMQSFFKILKGLGCTTLMVEIKGKYIPLNITKKEGKRVKT